MLYSCFGIPFINDISIFVHYLDVRSAQFLSGSKVYLGYLDALRVFYQDASLVVVFVFSLSIVPSAYQGKGRIGSHCIAVRSTVSRSV